MSDIQYTSEQLTQMQEAYEEHNTNAHLFDRQAESPNEITDSFQFKSKILQLDKDIECLLSNQVLLANLSNQDKKRAITDLILASDLRNLGLDPTPFVTDIKIICGISRGHRGFQQDKFNESREIRESKLQSSREKKKGFFKG